MEDEDNDRSADGVAMFRQSDPTPERYANLIQVMQAIDEKVRGNFGSFVSFFSSG